ncbi:MAG TPA: DUF2905 domain-containing protein [Cyclobacteriaceae bacterium]|jgi:hypothetical protein
MSPGKILIVAGLVLLAAGLIIQYAEKIPFLGKLPGDIVYQKGNVKVYIPITTSILISILLSLLLFFISRFRN